jgi:spore coat protein U-like protein
VKIRILIAAIAGLFVAQSPAFAASPNSPQSTTFTVKVKVDANCTISATDLDFGSYDPVAANKTAPQDVNTTVTVLCTKGSTGVTVGLNTGAHPAAGNRFMSNGTDTLQYELYSDSAGGTVWGNSGGGLVTWPAFGPIGGGTGVSHTVFGRIPAGQDVSVGNYTDTITATVNF